MKKLFLVIVALISLSCAAQTSTIWYFKYLKVNGQKIQYDSNRNGSSWKNLATEGYVQGYFTSNFNSLFDTRLATKSTTNLSEGTNLYYTDARARAAISLTFTTTGTSGAATGSYNNSTGVLSINVPQYTSGGGGLTGNLTVALTDGATINTDASQGYTVGATYRVTLGGNRTIANPTNLTDGQRLTYEIKQDATGNRTITWGSAFTWSDDLPVPTLSTAANYIDEISFVYNAGASKLYVTGINKGIH